MIIGCISKPSKHLKLNQSALAISSEFSTQNKSSNKCVASLMIHSQALTSG